MLSPVLPEITPLTSTYSNNLVTYLNGINFPYNKSFPDLCTVIIF